MLLLSDLILRIQYHQYNFFSFIDYMVHTAVLKLFGSGGSTQLSSDGLSVRDGTDAKVIEVTKDKIAIQDLSLSHTAEDDILFTANGEKVMSISSDDHPAGVDVSSALPLAYSILNKYPDRTKFSGWQPTVFKPIAAGSIAEAYYPHMNALFAGTYLTKDAEVCGGNMTITSLCFQLGSLATAPVPESAIAPLLCSAHSSCWGKCTLLRRISGLMWVPSRLLMALPTLSTFPLPAAVTAARLVDNYAALKWDQARVDQTMNEFEGLVVALDEAAPGWSVHPNGSYGISSYFRFLLAIHIKKLIMLSGLNTNSVLFIRGRSEELFENKSRQ